MREGRTMGSDIWVVAEQWQGQISEVTHEAVALGRELADASQAKLVAVLLGRGAGDRAELLGDADLVLCLEDPSLDEFVPAVYAEALSPLVADREPRCVLIPLTNLSLGLETLLAVRTGAPVVNFCADLQIVEGRLEARCVVYGGKIEATLQVPGPTAVLGLWPGVRPAASSTGTSEVEVEVIPISLPEASKVRFEEHVEPEVGDVDITRHDVLVAVGRGLMDEENLAPAEELAKLLGGAVCGSRPTIDQGWLPLSRQVGKSGLTVKPKLYLALGISGAPEHMEGVRGAGLIVAVNTDRQAPIFQVAHYGIVADVLDLMPELAAAIEGRKGAASRG